MPKTGEQLKRQFENFLTTTEIARTNAARDRDYVDHIQWTSDEEESLRQRNQAPVVINRLKVKVNFLCGAERNGRGDPRALPRTPDHEDASDAATDALRFVAENSDLDQTASAAFEDKIVWGTEAVITEVKQNGNGEFEIHPKRIQSDRFYYDPHSRELDFSDAKFMGIVIWMDEDDVVETFDVEAKDIANLIDTAHDSVDGSTFDDQPKWVDTERRRLRVCQHYYLEAGVWFLVYFSGETFLEEAKPSPLLDEFDQPQNPIEAQTAYIDRENNRYGEARAYVWVQDEINHRRSKALYNLSVRQTLGDAGAVEDINVMKQEMAKANGHIELTTEGARFEILENQDLTAGQFDLYQDAKNEIDSIGANSALSGEPDSGSLSGRAIQALQQGGLTELSSLFDGHRSFKRRIYRQIWNRVRQFWDEEKWIRVTDDESNLRWVGLNQPITLGQQLQEAAQAGDERATAALQELIAAQDPRLNETVEVRNNPAELDIDIILTETQDIATLRQEQFDTMATLAQSYGPEEVPFEVMLRLSDLPHKEQVEELLSQDDVPPEVIEEQEQLEDVATGLEIRQANADAAAKEAKARKDDAEAEAQEIENKVVLAQVGNIVAIGNG